MGFPEISGQILVYDKWKVAFFLRIFSEVAIQKIQNKDFRRLKK